MNISCSLDISRRFETASMLSLLRRRLALRLLQRQEKAWAAKRFPSKCVNRRVDYNKHRLVKIFSNHVMLADKFCSRTSYTCFRLICAQWRLFAYANCHRRGKTSSTWLSTVGRLNHPTSAYFRKSLALRPVK